jgi:hypothetical protein
VRFDGEGGGVLVELQKRLEPTSELERPVPFKLTLERDRVDRITARVES